MKYFRHNINGEIYTIERVVHDIHHLNNNAFAGIHATPWNHHNECINFYSKSDSECEAFVTNTFTVVSDTNQPFYSNLEEQEAACKLIGEYVTELIDAEIL
jgi:hypothetical protein